MDKAGDSLSSPFLFHFILQNYPFTPPDQLWELGCTVKSHFYPFLTVLPVLPSNLFVPAVLWTVIFLFCPPNPRNSVFLALVAASLTMAHSLLIFCFISLSLSRSLCPSFSTFSVFGFFISKLYFCFLLLCPTLSSHF